MKTVLILGDSWGVPAYNSHYPNPEFPYIKKEYHTEFQLKSMGYNVLNFSLNGGSNIETIDYAISALKGNNVPKDFLLQKRDLYNKSGEPKFIPIPQYKGEKIDWIVWFHTEAVRDANTLEQSITIKYLKLQELHDLFITASYRAFKTLLDLCPNVKTAIIGGQAPVDSKLYEFHKPDFIIEDWRSEILGKKLPHVMALSRLATVELCHGDSEEKLPILDSHKVVYDAMHNRELFFDHCHPGLPHIDLARRLQEQFQKN